MIAAKIFTGKMGIVIDDDYHEVYIFNEDKKLKKGFGYIKGNYVYIYHGKVEKRDIKKMNPGIYKDKNGNYVFVEPKEKDLPKYHVDNIIDLDMNSIFQQLKSNEENFIDPERVEVINNNAEVFVPTINEDDDFLKYLVKVAIIQKKINLKNYRGKFSNQYQLNNLKSGLNKGTKMTVTNFKVWCEILGLKWQFILEDDGTDRYNPLPEPIVIESQDF